MKNSTENHKPILVKIAEQLMKDQQELDSLAVQLSLGKAEVKGKLEEVKAELKQKIGDLKTIISVNYAENEAWAKDTIRKLDALDAKLTDSAEELFEDSKRNILEAAKEVENEIEKNPAAQKISVLFATYSEKVKLQFELLEQNIQGKKMEINAALKEKIHEAQKKINGIIEHFSEKKEEADLKLEVFKDEIGAVYDHLKKAFRALG